MSNEKNVYPRIRDLREDADLTQDNVAEKLGMWLNTYRNYETGNREPPFEFMIKLSKFYNVSLDYFAGFISTPKPLKNTRPPMKRKRATMQIGLPISYQRAGNNNEIPKETYNDAQKDVDATPDGEKDI